jgi:hypothetical protein
MAMPETPEPKTQEIEWRRLRADQLRLMRSSAISSGRTAIIIEVSR